MNKFLQAFSRSEEVWKEKVFMNKSSKLDCAKKNFFWSCVKIIKLK